MVNNWEKIGRIYYPSFDSSWMHSHASVPFAHQMNDNLYRIFFSPRCTNNISRVGWVDIDIQSPCKIIKKSEKPFIEIGKIGTYCDTGIMPSWIFYDKSSKKYYFYFIGWTKRVTVPFHQAIGEITLAKLPENIINKTYPILDRSKHDHFYVTNPCIVKNKSTYYMYYLSCLDWFDKNSPKSKYGIKVATSDDLIKWNTKNDFLFPMKGKTAYARPSVIIINKVFHMWYSVRKKARDYVIRHASSNNGIDFKIDNRYGLEPSNDGWDSEMVAYPHVFKFKGNIFMLYCGNDYSNKGFGIAKIREI